jgi:HAD superfamily hydrolase (TIGR01458 family)
VRPRGLILDLDGTVYEGDAAIPGAGAAIAALRDAGLGVRFVTNTTRVSPDTIAGWLEGFGIPVRVEDVFTPLRTAASWLRRERIRRVALCLPEDAHREFAGLEVVDENPEAVVIGDLGPAWSFEVMNRVFRWLLDGASFVALHRNRYWKSGGELVLDAGAFVAAFEYATGREATLVGKPSRPLFEDAARSMGLELPEVAVIGDDVTTDVAGAQALGTSGILVRTGKFRPGDAEAGRPRPDHVIESIADLPGLLLG